MAVKGSQKVSAKPSKEKLEKNLVAAESLSDGSDVASPLTTLFKANVSDNILPIDILKIEPDPNQPRKFFDQDSLDSLKYSIDSSSLLEPIMVSKNEEKTDYYFIVDGERRWKACSALNAEKSGYDKLKCVIVENDSQVCELIALTKNIQREDLLPIEKANAIADLFKKMQEKDPKYQQSDLAGIINLKKSSISEYLKISNLNDEIREEAGKSKEWTATKLLELAKIEDEQPRHDKFKEYKAKITGETDGETVSASSAEEKDEIDLTVSGDSQNKEDLASGKANTRNTAVTVDRMKVRLNSCKKYLKKIQKQDTLTVTERNEIKTVLDEIVEIANKIFSADNNQ
jgi:ParB/RepB/Spo0J family partition protein